ncbi:MAG: hypothetical protein GEU88_16900 [Solirubrobacterales bacterium]|nr:hypothetical protein [Solirubrobacterales bacterium]
MSGSVDGDARCGRRRRGEPGELRPSDMLVAFLWAGIAFLLAAAAMGLLNALVGIERGRWLAVHMALVGGASQLVLGASQFFAGSFLATGPPPRSLIRAQLALWNGGTLALAWGVGTGTEPLTVAGAAGLLAGLGSYAAGLGCLRRESLQRRLWALRWYVTAACFLAVGIVAGALLATQSAWPHGDLLSAHLALNVGGWLGCAIVGTLHTFYPSLTRTQLAFPRLQPATYGAWIAGVGAIAAGYALAVPPLARAGWVGVLVGASLLAANVAASARSGWPPPLPAQLVGAAQGCLIAGLLVAMVGVTSTDGALVSDPERTATAVLLLAGWVGLTVLGSLAHLLAVVRHVRTLPRPSPPRSLAVDPYLTPLALLGVIGLAAAQFPGLGALAGPGGPTLLVVYSVMGARVVALAGTALHAAPLRI